MCMKMIKCGTLVTTKVGGVHGMITGATIRFENIIYEMTYYAADEFKTGWFKEEEINIDDSNVKKIGFNLKTN